ncbi:2-polyprenyl-6-methoxyphenol hydroxylase-like FAD-dependent oxidoreductase [Mycobacterium sp. OAS707]|uniref:FAD-dependent monooxygenase n=1 Tax=Mycobacterium sp. OAS707 TaxID=2663822 RepID=UPI00178B7A46|nr:FAD-dependent monooxygenase [Mycobacterium sp. OAS707]MBE1546070.1 2-polyprenyl-6-methoxyphenol hydroxylase-like FAD-dependent oxidoreductase [Mycobacterium sp. OAS707]
MTDVLIAGGGIGGLTAALTLHARGIDPIVLERASQLRPLGVGINLLPHAVSELYTLGLGEKLAQKAVAPTSISYYDTDGELLFCEPRGIDGGYGYPQYSVHRGELQLLLLSALRERLGANAVRTGAQVDGFDETADGVRVHTSAGEFTADALIGADGIHSAVRAQLHPGPDPLLWSGVRMFRGAAAGDFLDGATMVIVKDPDGIDLVTYPIGGGLINWVVMMPQADPRPLPGDAKWNQPGDRTAIVAHLKRWKLGFLDAADLVRRTDSVLEYPMVDRDVLPWWGRGRVTLLGDAAHPMYPVGANGGSQAIVDARVLADELARDVVDGLRSYEDIRRPETADVVTANRDMHATGATQRPEDLAKVTGKYRVDTRADEVKR